LSLPRCGQGPAIEAPFGRPTARQASISFPPSLTSVAYARSFVVSMLELWGVEDGSDVACLLTSELVTNAVRYARLGIALSLELAADEESLLLVTTADDHPDLPVLRDPSPDSESGRGLLLVDRLARRWGARPAGDGGKVVWFELTVHPTRRPAAPRAHRCRRPPSPGR
jgi:hypothetical protein